MLKRRVLGREGRDASGGVASARRRTMEEYYLPHLFQCTQEKEVGDSGAMQHAPNYIVAQTVCDSCEEDWDRDSTCVNCGPHQVHFEGKDCLPNFCNWIFSAKHKGFVGLAHNGKGYDNQFVLSYLLERGIKLNNINRGLEIMKLELEGVKLLDSLNFLPMGLAALPAAFGITDVEKGFFPHFFNKEENWGYVGPYPDSSYYGTSYMVEGQHKKFKEWYEEQKGKEFNFKEELHKYCVSDVDVLRQSSMRFRKICKEATGGIECFAVAVTIASACMFVFRRLFLKEEDIAVVPFGGYRRKDRQSIIGLKWLKWLCQQQGVQIQHAGNKGEVKICGHKVDGYYEDGDEKRVYEFNG